MIKCPHCTKNTTFKDSIEISNRNLNIAFVVINCENCNKDFVYPYDIESYEVDCECELDEKEVEYKGRKYKISYCEEHNYYSIVN